ncbi:hypothetical protein [Sphingobacterium gobiense]|nr:hypothetical protein [Sphingobacterium gobiense]
MSLLTKLTVGVLLAWGIIFVTGCAKDAKQNITEDTGEGTRVVIRVEGINNGQGEPALKGKVGGSTASSAAATASFVEAEGFDVFVSQQQTIEKYPKRKAARTASASSAGALRGAAMEEGISYRVFLYENGALAASALLTSGTQGSIAVEKGKTYQWAALSYNSIDEVPAADGDNLVQLLDGQDVLYASGNFTVANDDGDVAVPLNITFDHRLSRVAIELNTMGMFAPIISANVKVTGLNLAPEAIDIKTGDLVGDTQQEATIAFGDFSPINDEGDRMVAYAYVGGRASEKMTVSVSNLVVRLVNNTPRSFGDVTLTQEFLPQPGMNQSVVLGFIESPLWKGGVAWARANLYYQEGHNPYRFHHLNAQEPTFNGYFSFGGHIPGRWADADNPIDPCSLVYPAGRWKQPSLADIDHLTGGWGMMGYLFTMPAAVEAPGAIQGFGYIEYQADAGVSSAYGTPSSATNRLRFNFNGAGRPVNLISNGYQAVNLEGSYLLNASVWTSEADMDLLGLSGLAAWSYEAGNRQLSLGTDPVRPVANNTAGLLNNVNIVDEGIISSMLRNVRCVRDGAWDPDAPGYDPYPVFPN